jgi:hypothetical protein
VDVIRCFDGKKGRLRFGAGQERHDDDRAEKRGDEKGRKREELHAKREASGKPTARDKGESGGSDGNQTKRR